MSGTSPQSFQSITWMNARRKMRVTSTVTFDDQPPVFSGCEAIEVEIESDETGANVTFDVTATDNCSGNAGGHERGHVQWKIAGGSQSQHQYGREDVGDRRDHAVGTPR